MKSPMTDNIESVIEEYASNGHRVTLVVETTERKNPDEKYVAFISNVDDKYDVIRSNSTLGELVAYGASFNSALNKLNELCA